ncbi:MAG: hypothetical protein Kow0037_00930 [Calditrichia bacterium]
MRYFYWVRVFGFFNLVSSIILMILGIFYGRLLFYIGFGGLEWSVLLLAFAEIGGFLFEIRNKLYGLRYNPEGPRGRKLVPEETMRWNKK